MASSDKKVKRTAYVCISMIQELVLFRLTVSKALQLEHINCAFDIG